MALNRITAAQTSAIAALIRPAEHILIFTHLSPDGDALGSSLGFAHFLRAIGKKDVKVVIANEYPSFLAWMPGAADICVYDQRPMDEFIEQFGATDLVICTDFSETKRVGDIEPLLRTLIDKNLPRIIVDHHPADPLLQSDWRDSYIIDPSAPAASELVFLLLHELIDEMHTPKIPMESATCLYTGLMTDTGNFAYNSNHPELYRIIADLIELGVDKDACYDHVYNAYSEDRMRLVGYCLYHKMKTYELGDTKVSLIALSRKDLYRFNFSSGDAEGIVNMPESIGEVKYSCFMREDGLTDAEQAAHPGVKQKVKISLRSQGNRPVNTFCHDIFGGGGHANASGGTYFGPLQEAVALFEQNFRKYFIG